jgi:hypothetical protein
LRVLRWQHMPFWVRHEAQDSPSRVAQPSDVALTPIWIVRIGRMLAVGANVAKHDLPSLCQPLQNPFFPCDESPFAVGGRHVQVRDSFEKYAIPRRREETHPAIFESTVGVVGERGEGAVFVRGHEEAGFEDRLEAVADAEDQFFVIAEFADGFGEKMFELIGQNLPSGDVIAVGKAPWDDENLEVMQFFWRFAELIDVEFLDVSTSGREGERGLVIAVGSWAAKDQNTRSRHDENPEKKRVYA